MEVLVVGSGAMGRWAGRTLASTLDVAFADHPQPAAERGLVHGNADRVVVFSPRGARLGQPAVEGGWHHPRLSAHDEFVVREVVESVAQLLGELPPRPDQRPLSVVEADDEERLFTVEVVGQRETGSVCVPSGDRWELHVWYLDRVLSEGIHACDPPYPTPVVSERCLPRLGQYCGGLSPLLIQGTSTT